MTARVRMEDLRSLRYCAGGVRSWCQRYGFDLRQLCGEGLDADAVEATGDELGIRAAEAARAREGQA
jgi:hypothetical protein